MGVITYPCLDSSCLWNHVIYLRLSFRVASVAPELSYCDDVIKWKHFLRYWPLVRGIHRSPMNSSNKGQ